MPGLLDVMSAAGGAIALIDRLTEKRKRNPKSNPKGRNVRKSNPDDKVFRVQHDFAKYQPRWTATYAETFGENNEGFLVTGADAKSAFAAWNEAQKPGARLNPFYLKITEVKNNPRSRSKRGITRPSQITGKTPTKRLVARRRATAKAPKGFYANPVIGHKVDAEAKRLTGKRVVITAGKREGEFGVIKRLVQLSDRWEALIEMESDTELLYFRPTQFAFAPVRRNPADSRVCHFGIKLNAGNDRNGNPRRAVIFLRHNGKDAAVVKVVNEDYSGTTGAIQEAGLDPTTTPVIGTFDVSASEYKRVLKLPPGIAF